MANTLFYCVFSGAGEVALGDPVEEGTIDVSGGENKSSVISSDTNVPNKRMRVRFFADDDMFVTWGDDPTAKNDGTEGRPLGAENPAGRTRQPTQPSGPRRKDWKYSDSGSCSWQR